MLFIHAFACILQNKKLLLTCIDINKTSNQIPSKIMFRVTVSAAMVLNRILNFCSGHK